MTKETKRTLVLTTIVCLIPIIAGAVLYPRLPEQIVTHWAADGTPNGWSSRFVGALVLPGILLILNLLMPLLLKTDPKFKDMTEKTKSIVQWIIPVTELFASGTTLAYAVGAKVKIELLAPLFMGVLFIIIGNYMPKMSRSYTVGIKLPWTLDDDDNWHRTHRLAGFVWVLCGILMIAAAFFPCRMVLFCILLGLMTLVPVIYSYVLFLKKKKQ